MIRFVNVFSFFVAFLLLLLVSVSLPIANSIKFFSLSVNAQEGLISSGVRGGVDFGNWGWCTTPLVVEVIGFDHTEPGECSEPQLGFSVDNRLVQLLGLEDLSDSINRGLTFALVLHPITCGLTFLALLLASLTVWRQSRLAAIVGLVVGVIDGILALIAFILDVTIVAVTKKNIEKISDNFHVSYGSTPWLTLVATILIWVGTVIFCMSIFTLRREKRKEVY